MYVLTWGRSEIRVCSVLVNSLRETLSVRYTLCTFPAWCAHIVDVLWHEIIWPPHVFQPFLFCSISVSFGVRRPREAIKPQISLQWLTYSQSVSLPSVCSHLISAHTLCLSLPSPRWWDAICIGHTHARSHPVYCAVPPVMASWLSISVCMERREEHNTNTTVSLSSRCNIRNQCVAVISAYNLHPEPCCAVCMCVCLCIEAASIPARLHSGIL